MAVTRENEGRRMSDDTRHERRMEFDLAIRQRLENRKYRWQICPENLTS